MSDRTAIATVVVAGLLYLAMMAAAVLGLLFAVRWVLFS